jgi:hypothetical protein
MEPIDRITPYVRMRDLLVEDSFQKLNSLTVWQERFRTIAGVTEGLSQFLLYFAASTSVIVDTVRVIGPEGASDVCSATGTIAFAAHVLCLGIARYSRLEALERMRASQEIATTHHLSVDQVAITIQGDSVAPPSKALDDSTPAKSSDATVQLR